MSTSHQICMIFQYHDDELCYSFIASKIKISENLIYLFLGLIDLPLREYFTTSSSSSSASSSSSSSSIFLITTFLSPLISAFLSSLTPSLTPLLTSSLLSYYNRSNNYNRFNKICKESSYINISESNIRNIVVFFLTKLLSLLENLKKSALTRILLNFYFSFLRANIFIRSLSANLRLKY